jgi:ATP-dependent helicase HrpB
MSSTFPVLEVLDKLREALNTSRITILEAPPGAGKSTVLPLRLIEEPWLKSNKIVMLEPRRLAAKSVAQRMASMLGQNVGQSVGYRVRFDTCVSEQTKIEVVTEGILTRMIQGNNILEGVGLLIFDEFHERSIHADLSLALSLQVQQVLRDDLRILIMSATLHRDQLSSALPGAKIITAQGRQYPVAVHYTSSESQSPVAVKTAAAVRKAMREEPGDILVFLPGAAEILRTKEILEQELLDAVVYTLYGDLPFRQQQEAILPRQDGRRKIILSSAIAETSLTIEGIRIVIDSGLARVPRFDPRSGLTRLDTIPVTKDAADQRAGRAGRLAPGVCYRLWSQGFQLNLQAHRKPEILEADLAPMILELAQWGVKNIAELTWITTPPAGAVAQAIGLLKQLDAIDDNGITERGKSILRLPTHPRIAHMLLSATKDLLSMACDLAALLEERDPLEKEAGADLSLRVALLRRWREGERVNADKTLLERTEKLSENWRRFFQVKPHRDSAQEVNTGKLLIYAYPERIAQQQGAHSERYKLVQGRIAKLSSHDPLLREPWLAIAQLDAGSQEGKIFLAAAVDVADLLPLSSSKDIVRWDEEREMISAVKERRIGNLVLESKPIPKADEETRIETICRVAQEKGVSFLGWSDEVEFLQARILSLRRWRKEEAWPNVETNHLLATIHTWLSPYLVGISKRSELVKLDYQAIIKGLIPWDLQSKLDILAPSRIAVPTGSLIRLQYHETGSPVLEVRLQEMFGLADTPTVNDGRTKVLLHLLSPGYKPVQVTQDLKSFWHTTYHEVRKELRLRYPKHHWPEDPWTAEPVRGAKRSK